MPNQRPLPTSLAPTEADKAAVDRAIRLAHEHGTLEVAQLFADIPERNRAAVFALMARQAARAGVKETTPPDVPSPWWTAAELRDAHRLWARGFKDRWVEQGHRLYLSQNARQRRAVESPDQGDRRRASAAAANRKRRARVSA